MGSHLHRDLLLAVVLAAIAAASLAGRADAARPLPPSPALPSPSSSSALEAAKAAVSTLMEMLPSGPSAGSTYADARRLVTSGAYWRERRTVADGEKLDICWRLPLISRQCQIVRVRLRPGTHLSSFGRTSARLRCVRKGMGSNGHWR
uniref:Uncharacterized protein n=2 Tax=Oryza TaxID=4527 RepID=A0A0D9YIK2_9ORYZ